MCIGVARIYDWGLSFNADRFLSRVKLTRDIDIAILSVRDTLVLYENGLTYRHSFFHHAVAQSF